jgi:hypothetical protein
VQPAASFFIESFVRMQNFRFNLLPIYVFFAFPLIALWWWANGCKAANPQLVANSLGAGGRPSLNLQNPPGSSGLEPASCY